MTLAVTLAVVAPLHLPLREKKKKVASMAGWPLELPPRGSHLSYKNIAHALNTNVWDSTPEGYVCINRILCCTWLGSTITSPN